VLDANADDDRGIAEDPTRTKPRGVQNAERREREFSRRGNVLRSTITGFHAGIERP